MLPRTGNPWTPAGVKVLSRVDEVSGTQSESSLLVQDRLGRRRIFSSSYGSCAKKIEPKRRAQTYNQSCAGRITTGGRKRTVTVNLTDLKSDNRSKLLEKELRSREGIQCYTFSL